MGHKTKSFTLISGCEDGVSWNIVTTIDGNGMFIRRGGFNICDNESNRIYYEKHKEEMRRYNREHSRKFRKSHKQKINEYSKSYRKSHKEEGRLYLNKWRQSHNGKKCMSHYRAKRRNLGFFELNVPFEKSEGHHIDFENVLYIPKYLHRSIKHNIFTGKNMGEINDLAFQWIAMQENFECLNSDLKNRRGKKHGENNNKDEA